MTPDTDAKTYPMEAGRAQASAGTRIMDPAHPAPIKFSEVTAWALLMMGVAYWANVARSTDPGEALSLTTMANSIISEGAFNVLAWYVLFENVWAFGRETGGSLNDRATGRQILMALLISAICIAPSKQATAVAMLAFAVFLYHQGKLAIFARRISLILAALAFEVMWTSHYIDFFHVAVGRIDAHAVAAIYRAFGYAVTAHGNVVEDPGGQFAVIVIGPCSSSYTLAGICVAFVVTSLFRQRDLRRSSLGWLCAAYLASIVLTELRLVLTTESATSYEWWHNGPGFPIYSLAATASVAFFAIMATSAGTTRKRREVAL